MKTPQQHHRAFRGEAQAPALGWSEGAFHSRRGWQGTSCLLLLLLELPCTLSGLHWGGLICKFYMLEGNELLLSFSSPYSCYKPPGAVGLGKQCWTGYTPEHRYTHREGISCLSADSLLWVCLPDHDSLFKSEPYINVSLCWLSLCITRLHWVHFFSILGSTMSIQKNRKTPPTSVIAFFEKFSRSCLKVGVIVHTFSSLRNRSFWSGHPMIYFVFREMFKNIWNALPVNIHTIPCRKTCSQKLP